jgi:hypothetical protein
MALVAMKSLASCGSSAPHTWWHPLSKSGCVGKPEVTPRRTAIQVVDNAGGRKDASLLE